MSEGYMRAGVLTAPGAIAIRQQTIPEPGPGEVRIRMKAVGICGSDVSIFQGHRPDLLFPLVIGHEGLGYVDKTGEGVSQLQVGDRVVIEPNFPCGHCDFCWQGRGNICPNKRIFGVRETGCFADYALAPEHFVWRVPDAVSDDDAVVIEPTAVALHTLFTSPARPGDPVAVVGMGAIGLLVAYLAVRMGYKVLAYDRVQEKVDRAVELGAVPVDASTTTAQIAQIWKDASVHTVFECAGAAPAFTMALEAAPRGSYVVVAGLADGLSNLSEFSITRQGITILTSIIYDHPVDFRRTIALIESGFLRPGQIISAKESFDRLPNALEMACRGQHAKIVLSLSS
ncbi:alcohol dehydrogenase catalytic domain-containing protein [Spirosoma taeanense]|uniref:Alcohol dehydrogenase catalytic domain-containing protein n=1 Tax=Spirosoma taeanense TaxID=2735870 RepID=A0A6M5YC99_9BACT|nr:alcohol dehydrogenase catalytic domain-containing protein [Spirosoma taeanense]QJW90906.1 alcohol dehydrogenase catalytic domain-containing protein [Spirosoma taeanense]